MEHCCFACARNRIGMHKMKLKKGDQVVVISGKDAGKTGAIIRVFPKEARILVDGVNIVKRHVRKSGRGQSGRIVERPAPLHLSNVMLVDPETKKPTRVGRKLVDGTLVRYAKKSGKELK